MNDIVKSEQNFRQIRLQPRGMGVALVPQTVGEVVTLAEMMSRAGQAVPKHCRGEPGICFAIASRALVWEMDPFAVATKTYVVNDAVAYEAQLVASLIHTRAPIIGRPRYTFIGSGDDLQCKITWKDEADSEPMEYLSPKIGTITPKNSPLWKSHPDQQLGYHSIRAMARRYYPELLLGVYTPDEMPQVQAERSDYAKSFDQMEQAARVKFVPDPAVMEKDAAKIIDSVVAARAEPVKAPEPKGPEVIDGFVSFARWVASATDWELEIKPALKALQKLDDWKEAGDVARKGAYRAAFARLSDLNKGEGSGADPLTDVVAYRCLIEWEDQVDTLKWYRKEFCSQQNPAWSSLSSSTKSALDNAMAVRLEFLAAGPPADDGNDEDIIE